VNTSPKTGSGGELEAENELREENRKLRLTELNYYSSRRGCPLDPFARESLDQVANPAGIRLGVLEMTRFGMKEPEMEMIARFFKEGLIDGKYVGEEVAQFRQTFPKAHYSFDHLKDTEVLSLSREKDK